MLVKIVGNEKLGVVGVDSEREKLMALILNNKS